MPTLIKCSWMDKLFGLLPGSPDPDMVLAFQTERVVKINDRVLGCFAHCCTITIFVYIMVDLYLNRGHLLVESPTGTSKLSVMMPPYDRANGGRASSCSGCTTSSPTCPPGTSCPCPVAWPVPTKDFDMPYCAADSAGLPTKDSQIVIDGVRMPCMFWDQEDKRYLVPMTGSQLLITTRVKQSVYDTTCDQRLSGGSGASAWNMTAVNPQCVAQAKASGKYPGNTEYFKGFVAGVEGSTIKIDHTVSGSVNVHLERRLTEMRGALLGCDEDLSVVRYLDVADFEEDSVLCDMTRHRLFTLEELLRVADLGLGDNTRCGLSLDEPSLIDLPNSQRDGCRGKDLRQMNDSKLFNTDAGGVRTSVCGESVRMSGVVMIIQIEYDNTNSGGFDALHDVEYTMRVRALGLSEAEFEQVSLSSGGGYLYEGRRGVLLIVQQGGKLGVFSFKALLINLTAGLGLLAAAKVITVLVAKFVCPRMTGDRRVGERALHSAPRRGGTTSYS
eukprot:TRINITY_DN13202_c0_g1_i2.p1 TRINITY_DN13202_c0_g1~~TRINITY_DN13202_c0_g1_i2.p1  ORF type:complete len:500 (+),score=152.92 TRINITY_DN13202_c0_g1_i2:58-1557(+)